MIVTQRFLSKIKSFLKQIDYSYTDRYYPEVVDRTVTELIPFGQDIETISELLKDYRYIKNREKKIIKVFETPKYYSKYQATEPSSTAPIYKTYTKNHDQVVVTNVLSSAFKLIKNYQVYSTYDDKVTTITKDKAFFTQGFNAFKVKTFVKQVELYRYEEKIMKFSLDYFMKKYRFKVIEMSDNFKLEQDGTLFKAYTTNLDNEKVLIGVFEFKILVSTYVFGVTLIKIFDEQYHDMLTILGLGMLYSILYSENSRRSAS